MQCRELGPLAVVTRCGRRVAVDVFPAWTWAVIVVIRLLVRGLPTGCLFQRLSGELTLRAQTGPAQAVEVRQDRAADIAGEVAVRPRDVAGAGDQILGSLDGDLVAGAVGVGARHGLYGVGDGRPQRLVQRQQRPHLLFQPGRVAGARHPAVQQGVPQRQVGSCCQRSW